MWRRHWWNQSDLPRSHLPAPLLPGLRQDFLQANVQLLDAKSGTAVVAIAILQTDPYSTVNPLGLEIRLSLKAEAIQSNSDVMDFVKPASFRLNILAGPAP